jgi:hypothetical protein
MNHSEATEILRQHNKWRREHGNESPPMVDPKKLGIAIDVVVKSMAAFEVAMTTLKQIQSTPRNAGARRNANATVRFIETQLGD